MKHTSHSKSLEQKADGYLFVFPIVFLMLALIVYPMIYGFYISFFNTNLVTKWKYVGLKYYLDAFGNPMFYQSVRLTLLFMALVVAGHFLVGFYLAVQLNKEFRGRTFYRIVFMLPWFFPEAVIALLFTWILNSMYGILNNFLLAIGLVSSNISWLGSKTFAFPSVVVACIWKGFPLVMTMILAGLQTIPKNLYEAAEIDGVSRFGQFWYITVPALRPILKTVLILDSVWWFKQYTLVYTMTGGGPGTATNLISLSVYNTAFNDLRFGKGSAWGILVFGICVLISVILKRIVKDES
jgi:multiple sugar transport system permease protein